MNTHIIKRKGWNAKLVALLLTAIMVTSVFAVHLSGTMAALNDIQVTLTCESGIPVGSHIEVGQTVARTASNLFEAESTNTSLALVTFTAGSSQYNIQTTGIKAGVVYVAYGTKAFVTSTRYQVIDSLNVSAYTIKDGGEVYFAEAGKTKASPVSVTAGDFSRITWKSMNEAVATVGSSGYIKSVGQGATIITGSFIDKWGVPRDLHLLVGVGVKLSGSDLGKLLELVQEGERILEHDHDKYTTDSLDDLQDAVNKGKDVLNSSNPSGQVVTNAVKDLEDALKGLAEKPVQAPGVLGPDANGNFYKPVGDPDNVYEVVDNAGKGKVPPVYVYNPNGDDGHNLINHPGGTHPANKDKGFYYVEDPDGSNIYKQVNGDGTLKDSPAVWGGPDKILGTGDDKPVNKFGTGYWLDRGQNVWQKVETPTTLGSELIGGGSDDNPVTDPVKPIYENGGKYYVGPLPPGTSGGYYYGDKQAGGDGKLNSSATSQHPTDDKYYLVNGNMVPESQLPGIPGLDSTNNGGTIVIDGKEWTKVRSDSTGKYAMLLLNNVIPVGSKKYDQYSGFNLEYNAADICPVVNNWYNSLSAPMLKRFAKEAMIGSADVQTWPSEASPAMTIYAFIPKKSDLSGLTASKRELGYEYWTATRTTSGSAVGFQVTVDEGGDWYYRGVTQEAYIRPAIWVRQN